VLSEQQPHMLKGSLTSKPSEVQRVHTGGEGEDGKVWHQNGSDKAAIYRHFSQLLDGEVKQRGSTLQWLRDQIAKYKIHQIFENMAS